MGVYLPAFYNEIVKDTDQQTDMRVNRKVALPKSFT